MYTVHVFVSCSPKKHTFGEHGTYRYVIRSIEKNVTCVLLKDKKAAGPDNPYLREYLQYILAFFSASKHWCPKK